MDLRSANIIFSSTFYLIAVATLFQSINAGESYFATLLIFLAAFYFYASLRSNNRLIALLWIILAIVILRQALIEGAVAASVALSICLGSSLADISLRSLLGNSYELTKEQLHEINKISNLIGVASILITGVAVTSSVLSLSELKGIVFYSEPAAGIVIFGSLAILAILFSIQNRD